MFCPEEENSHGEDSDEEKSIYDFLKLRILNSGNIPQQRNFSAKYCNGKNTIHPDIPGSDKYLQKLIHIPPGQTLQIQINELKSINNVR